MENSRWRLKLANAFYIYIRAWANNGENTRVFGEKKIIRKEERKEKSPIFEIKPSETRLQPISNHSLEWKDSICSPSSNRSVKYLSIKMKIILDIAERKCNELNMFQIKLNLINCW